MPRSLKELIDVKDPAWPMVRQWITDASGHVELLPPDPVAREQALLESQVTLRSPMGAVVFESGGILLDNGWLRLLGSGHPRLPRSMPAWNRSCSSAQSLGFWLIGDDVVGGFFALDGGALGSGQGDVYYFAPDALRWEPMAGMGYGTFLAWALGPKLQQFYQAFRWRDWQNEIASLGGNESLSIWPPLWTSEGKDIAACSRRPVPVGEVFDLNVIEFPKQLRSRKPKLPTDETSNGAGRHLELP